MKQMRLYLMFSILYASFSTSIAQRDFSDVVISSEKITDNIHMLQGAGGNILITSGDDGVFMIDNQFADLSEKIKIKIKELTGSEVNYLVNTHWHGDHTGGNENFGNDGALIIAHDNVRNRMMRGLTKIEAGYEKPPAPQVALPVITFDAKMKMHINDDEIHLFHFHNGHTDGDGIIYFPEKNIIHMGDTFFKDRFPYIDIKSGGNVNGLLLTLYSVLMIVDEETVIVPGHGSLAKKSDLQTYTEMIATLNDKIKALKKEGKTEEEIIAEDPTSHLDDSWGSGFINAEKFVGFLFKSEPLD